MNPQTVMSIGQQALLLTLLVSAPLLLAALITGLLVSIFQAATQINETTLTFIPKLVVTFIVLVATGPWIVGRLIDYTRQLIMSLPSLIG